MKPISLLALALVILFVVSPQSIAQSSSRRLPSPGSRNRNIANIVREIDAKNIERTIRQLVAFGTRNTLSEQNDPKRGIGFQPMIHRLEADATLRNLTRIWYPSDLTAVVPASRSGPNPALTGAIELSRSVRFVAQSE